MSLFHVFCSGTVLGRVKLHFVMLGMYLACFHGLGLDGCFAMNKENRSRFISFCIMST